MAFLIIRVPDRESNRCSGTKSLKEVKLTSRRNVHARGAFMGLAARAIRPIQKFLVRAIALERPPPPHQARKALIDQRMLRKEAHGYMRTTGPSVL